MISCDSGMSPFSDRYLGRTTRLVSLVLVAVAALSCTEQPPVAPTQRVDHCLSKDGRAIPLEAFVRADHRAKSIVAAAQAGLPPERAIANIQVEPDTFTVRHIEGERYLYSAIYFVTLTYPGFEPIRSQEFAHATIDADTCGIHISDLKR